MKTFITGAGGFIGAAVCRDLLAAGHELAILSRDAMPWRLGDQSNRVTLIRGNMENQAAWASALSDFGPDAVVHLAWSGVANFDRNRVIQIANISWTADLLALAVSSGAHVFLGMGSQAEHGPQSTIVGPQSPTSPTTLYGEAKLAAGRIAAKLAAAHGMRFLWMRVFSTYGPADHPYWVIPSVIGALLSGKRPRLTPCEQLWDFLHVADAARAVRLALETPAASGVYTLGSGQAPSLRSTIELIRDMIDPNLPLGFGDIPYASEQVMHLQADVTDLNCDIDWTAEMDLLQGLVETVKWYESNRWIFERERPV